MVKIERTRLTMSPTPLAHLDEKTLASSLADDGWCTIQEFEQAYS